MNLATIINDHPEDAVALVSRGQRTSYGELRRQVGELRGGLVRLGLEPGDRVAVVSANTWFFVVTYLAALGAGGVVVPLNPQSPAAELTEQLGLVRPKFLVVGPAGREAVAAINTTAVGVAHLLAPAGVSIDGAIALDALFGGEATAVVDRDDVDVAALLFTSGTSGAPKAAMLTHGSLRANLEQAQRHPGRAVQADDVVLGVLPLFHIFGLNVVLGLTLFAGAAVVLIERFDPVSALETVVNHKVTIVLGAPPMFTAWATMPATELEDAGAGAGVMAGVRLALTGAAPLASEVAVAFEQRFGVPVRQGYGLTEASPIVTSSVVDGEPKPDSIGVPLPGLEVRLVDESGDDAPQGDPGEIWVRGPNVFAGYWENDEASAAAVDAEGWLHTGDIAVADDDGFLFIVDRVKDLIIVSGFNVYPAEVEEALLDHPGISEVAVVGVRHPYSGETVKAFVVAEPGQHLEEDEVIEFCADRLARYKCPSKVMFVNELQRGPAGKMLRRALR
ncbi:MAG: AMP-binding protein [Actinobacteria bacterium]|nr:AMP-binding protein [Actinomycetota bacterium]